MIHRVKRATVATQFFKKLLNSSSFSKSCNIKPFVSYCVTKYWPVESPKFLENNLSSNKLFKYYYSSDNTEKVVDRLTFENACSETLNSLTEYFEELVETSPKLKNADVIYSDGVLTVNLGKNYGTYVINRQTPNLQIWLSSPKSGPKRYDFIDGTWVYKHDKTTLHSLLDQEIKEFFGEEVQFVEKCSYAKSSI